METFPKTRRENLIIEELPDELLIYDEERNQAHCLNQTAAQVWKECDGRTSVTEISEKVSAQAEAPVPEQVVWYALQQFERNHLLAAEMPPPPVLMAGMNRRQMVRALGLAAAVAVPLVTSVVAPTAVRAATCLPGGSACTTSAQCCSGLCNAGVCA